MTKVNNQISASIFILTGEWSDYSGKNALKFIGTSNEFGAVEIIITNNKPVFFVERSTELNSLIKKLNKMGLMTQFYSEMIL